MRMTLNEPGRHKNKPLRLRKGRECYRELITTSKSKFTKDTNTHHHICMSSPCLLGFFSLVLWYSLVLFGLPQSKYIVGVITGDCKLTVGVNGCLYLCVSLPQSGNLSRLDPDSHPDSWDRLQPLHLDTWIIRFNHCAPYKINKKYNFISKLGSRGLELHSSNNENANSPMGLSHKRLTWSTKKNTKCNNRVWMTKIKKAQSWDYIYSDVISTIN